VTNYAKKKKQTNIQHTNTKCSAERLLKVANKNKTKKNQTINSMSDVCNLGKQYIDEEKKTLNVESFAK
jgi:DNA/RNA-binding domain of Phe-tRNA-synthetase-like protein